MMVMKGTLLGRNVNQQTKSELASCHPIPNKRRFFKNWHFTLALLLGWENDKPPLILKQDLNRSASSNSFIDYSYYFGSSVLAR